MAHIIAELAMIVTGKVTHPPVENMTPEEKEFLGIPKKVSREEQEFLQLPNEFTVVTFNN